MIWAQFGEVTTARGLWHLQVVATQLTVGVVCETSEVEGKPNS